MSERHRALVVEDEPEAAADLVEILNAEGCDCVVASSRKEALEELAAGPFCIIFVDLEIKSDPGAIRGHAAHGSAFIREARARYLDHPGKAHSLPIVVVSGHALEPETAVAAMRDGASDVVQKLSSGQEKSERIREALEKAGRVSHTECAKLMSSNRAPSTLHQLVLDITGERDGQRVVVRLSQRGAKLSLTALKVLLRLICGRLSTDVWVHKFDLGAGKDGASFRTVSVLRQQLAVAYDGNEKELVTNDQGGSYCLAEKVIVGDIDTGKLEALGDHQITKLAREIRRLSNEIQASVGKD